MAADVGPPVHVGQASACAGLQSRWRDSYQRCGRRAKAPPQAEACPTCTGGPTLARKCEVIPAPAISTLAGAAFRIYHSSFRPNWMTRGEFAWLLMAPNNTLP